MSLSCGMVSAYYTLYTVIMKKNLFQKGGIHNEKQYL